MLLIAVGFDAKGYEGFVAHDPKLWTGDHLFVDKSKATYKALNAKKGSMFGLMKPAVIRAYNAAQSAGWSADELRKIGLPEPEKKARVRRRAARKPAASRTTPEPAETSADEGTAAG